MGSENENCDGLGKCSCKPAFAGVKCDSCNPTGYFGSPPNCQGMI